MTRRRRPPALAAVALSVFVALVGSACGAGVTDGASNLEDRTVVVDPGHGGTAETDTFRVGPTGEREEWINLRVALLLEEMLTARGANVVMTRSEDVHVDLQDRAALAHEVDADAFVSIHHNATADPDANFPIVYYHAYASANQAGVRLARLLARRLNEKLFDGQAPTSVVSDHVIFPGAGTSVLRNSYGIPGVIGEASFFTNPAEEERLRQEDYNRMEAEAYVLALEDFFAAPVPPVLTLDQVDPLEPFHAAREAERMGEAGLSWQTDVAEAKHLFSDGPDRDLERAYQLLVRSVRSFPDSHMAAEAHLLRAAIMEEQGRDDEARKARRRVREFYAGP